MYMKITDILRDGTFDKGDCQWWSVLRNTCIKK